MYSQIKLCVCHQVRRRRPDTRLNLQYDKLYVNNVAYWFNEDTEEIELVNHSDGDIESQVWGNTYFVWSWQIFLSGHNKHICTFPDRDEGSGGNKTKETGRDSEQAQEKLYVQVIFFR